jgi:hypothetical protein
MAALAHPGDDDAPFDRGQVGHGIDEAGVQGAGQRRQGFGFDVEDAARDL